MELYKNDNITAPKSPLGDLGVIKLKKHVTP
jgi:hypothetical protein